MPFTKGHKIRNTGRTLWKLGRTPWNRGIKISLKPKTGWEITCIVCGKEKYYQLNEHLKRKRVYCSLECYHKGMLQEEIGYSAIHQRIKKNYGKADICQECSSTSYVQWANMSHKYLLDRIDWKKLCRKCHQKYDRKKGWGDAKAFINLKMTD